MESGTNVGLALPAARLLHNQREAASPRPRRFHVIAFDTFMLFNSTKRVNDYSKCFVVHKAKSSGNGMHEYGTGTGEPERTIDVELEVATRNEVRCERVYVCRPSTPESIYARGVKKAHTLSSASPVCIFPQDEDAAQGSVPRRTPPGPGRWCRVPPRVTRFGLHARHRHAGGGAASPLSLLYSCAARAGLKRPIRRSNTLLIKLE